MVDAEARLPYDEFGMFADNAREVGLPYAGPPVVRRESVAVGDGRVVSVLVWGDGPPEFVLIHGGAQNAHTWDTVALALGRSLIALDLPGHGHSDQGAGGTSLDVRASARDVATVIRTLAPEARSVVGMSLGGMTTLALLEQSPELVRTAVLVDVTPGVTSDKSRAISDFVQGPPTFASFDDILARTIEHNPTRTESSLRRGILHNALQNPDGSWTWRYRRFPDSTEFTPQSPRPDFTDLWPVLDDLAIPILLVRGMRPQSVVVDADEEEFLRRAPHGSVVRIEAAGHSVQGDTPLELARILGEFAGA